MQMSLSLIIKRNKDTDTTYHASESRFGEREYQGVNRKTSNKENTRKC